MDGFYRGAEALLLAASFALGAFAIMSKPVPPRLVAETSVTLPLLAVAARR